MSTSGSKNNFHRLTGCQTILRQFKMLEVTYVAMPSVCRAAPCLGRRRWWQADPQACSCWLIWTGSPEETLCRTSSSPLRWSASIALKETERAGRCVIGDICNTYVDKGEWMILVSITGDNVAPRNVHKVADRLANEWMNGCSVVCAICNFNEWRSLRKLMTLFTLLLYYLLCFSSTFKGP